MKLEFFCDEPGCNRAATGVLRDRNDRQIGRYCKKHSRKALKRLREKAREKANVRS